MATNDPEELGRTSIALHDLLCTICIFLMQQVGYSEPLTCGLCRGPCKCYLDSMLLAQLSCIHFKFCHNSYSELEGSF